MKVGDILKRRSNRASSNKLRLSDNFTCEVIAIGEDYDKVHGKRPVIVELLTGSIKTGWYNDWDAPRYILQGHGVTYTKATRYTSKGKRVLIYDDCCEVVKEKEQSWSDMPVQGVAQSATRKIKPSIMLLMLQQ